MNTIATTLDYLVKSVVTDSSSIVINQETVDGVEVFTIEAAPEIIGQIIGKEGKIIKSIRTILNLVYPQVKYTLDIKG